MFELIRKFSKLTLKDVEYHFIVVFQKERGLVSHVYIYCTKWGLRHYLVLSVEFGWFHVQNALIDLIAMSNVTRVFVTDFDEKLILEKIIRRNARQITCEVISIKDRHAKPSNTMYTMYTPKGKIALIEKWISEMYCQQHK